MEFNKEIYQKALKEKKIREEDQIKTNNYMVTCINARVCPYCGGKFRGKTIGEALSNIRKGWGHPYICLSCGKFFGEYSVDLF